MLGTTEGTIQHQDFEILINSQHMGAEMVTSNTLECMKNKIAILMHSLRKMVVGKSFYVSLGCQHCMSLDSQVYLDAVFFPRALNDPRVLAQEGWHYEIEKKDDPLTFKGPRHGDLDGIW